jgi:hypothetical protein
MTKKKNKPSRASRKIQKAKSSNARKIKTVKPSGAIDNLREALQIKPAGEVLDRVDGRSKKSVKKIARDLSKKFRASEIAEALGISTQKWTALKRRITKGKAADPVLNDLLKDTAEKVRDISSKPRDMRGEYEANKPVNGRKKFKLDFVEVGYEYIKDKIKWATDVKPGGFASMQSALNWYGGVTGGKEYFKIVKRKTKGGRERIYIFDTRTPDEKSRKGSVSGSTKADRIIQKDLL